jgi:hypothetical protein
LQNTAIGTLLGFVKAPIAAGPSRDATVNSILDSRKTTSDCAP